MQVTAYTWLMIAGILVSLAYWRRNAPRRPGIAIIFFSGLVGAFVGGKIVYLLAEGWLHWNDPNRWLHLATGKTILGALLGGYAGVEISKRAVRYNGVTGDWFATMVPLSIILGRIGCLLHGCCLGDLCASPHWYTISDQQGLPRWPAVPAEILFNAIAAATFFTLRRRQLLPGQHFHLYLIAYGAFRFAHEFLRATPTIIGPFTGYHFAALTVVLLGAIRFAQRRAHLPPVLLQTRLNHALPP